MDSSISTLWTGPFPVEGESGYFLLSPCLIEIRVFKVNSVDRDHDVALCVWFGSTLFANVHMCESPRNPQYWKIHFSNTEKLHFS